MPETARLSVFEKENGCIAVDKCAPARFVWRIDMPVLILKSKRAVCIVSHEALQFC
jgi:hypothetical protein